MAANKEIQKLLNQADKIAEKKVIRLAREYLKSHPKLKHFTIAMGTYFFVSKKNDKVMHNYEPKRLWNFIEKWDEVLNISGNPMVITLDRVVRDW